MLAADLGNTADGWLTELIMLPTAALVPIPEGLDYADAAALGAAGITAWTVLETLGKIKAGDTVLALGTGGVSILALQIARLNGATVAITSSSDDKLAIARQLGATITVNYRRTPDWARVIREATGGRGVDIIVETVGMATLPESLACCAPNARVGLLGALGGRSINGPMPRILNNVMLKGITSGSRRMYADLLAAFAANGIRSRGLTGALLSTRRRQPTNTWPVATMSARSSLRSSANGTYLSTRRVWKIAEAFDLSSCDMSRDFQPLERFGSSFAGARFYSVWVMANALLGYQFEQ